MQSSDWDENWLAIGRLSYSFEDRFGSDRLFLNCFNRDNIDRIWWRIAHQSTAIYIEQFATVATLNRAAINTLERIATNWTFRLDDTAAQPQKEPQKSNHGGNND